ncbi:hypothetical protein L7F22_008047 [Adiantum nelumboides]|nr:hypothetical protein [Adiantum nelumboides]
MMKPSLLPASDLGLELELHSFPDHDKSLFSIRSHAGETLPSTPSKLHPHVNDDNLPLLPSSAHSLQNGAGFGGAVFNLATSIIGAGIMALPATMKVLGLPLGFLAIVVMGLISEGSIELLILFSTHIKVWTYGEPVQGACGLIGRKLSEVCIIVNNAGILIVYLIIIGEVLSGSKTGDHEGFLNQLAGHKGWWSNRSLVILLTLVIVLVPFCFLKRIDSLRFSSAASVLLAVLFVVLATGIAVVKLFLGDLSKPRLLPDTSSVLDLLVVIPIMTNAFICHFNVHPIYYELQDRTPAAMRRVGRASTLLCVVVYSMTAISGYLLFGDSTASDVLTNFDKNLGVRYSALLNAVIRVGYVIHLMLVFPVIHYSLRQTVELLLFPHAKESNRRFVCITLVQLVLIYLGSAFIPNIWIAFQFTGATTGLSLGFIFPASIGIRWCKLLNINSGKRRAILICCWSMLGMAVLVSCIGISGNVISVVKGLHH